MKILGIDVSTTSTGWGVIEFDKLVDYGKINPTGITSLYQKLNVFYLESKKLISRFQPDLIVLEEVIYVRNIKTMQSLAKIHGVVSLASFQHLNKDPKVYVPTEWKKILGHGHYLKCEVQLLVCKRFDLLSFDMLKYYDDEIRKIRKMDIKVKESKKLFEQLSVNIYGRCNLNNDEADAIAMCMALEKELL